MYSVTPLGINTRQTDKEVLDGFLKECINLQRRDGSFKPIPNRLLSDINTTLYGKIILHKVTDENQINVLGFTRTGYGYLAEDLSAYLGGGEDTLNGNLTWFGTILDGVYTANSTPQILPVIRTAGMSWTILNGLLYVMGDGTKAEERYYKRVQFNEGTNLYEEKDMYAWKTLIPYYPEQVSINLTAEKSEYTVFSQCGFVLIRITLVLKTGEEVLHSPAFVSYLYGLNRSDEAFTSETFIDNIHTFINMNFQFQDNNLFLEEISAINIYASIPFYQEKLPDHYDKTFISNGKTGIIYLIDDNTLKGEIQNKAEQPFYLVKTIEKPTTDQLLLYVDKVDNDIVMTYTSDSTNVVYSKVEISTIAAGQPMPVDNFSYHKLYGSITSFNGRLVIEKPVTVLSDGCMRSLALIDSRSKPGVKIETEDGNYAIGNTYDNEHVIDKSLYFNWNPPSTVHARGIISYPDTRANSLGDGVVGTFILMLKCRKNKFHNMSCAFNIGYVGQQLAIGLTIEGDNFTAYTGYSGRIVYYGFDELWTDSTENQKIHYSSNNRVQFSAIGEYSVWPAINSERVGDGEVVKVGANNVDPKSANIVSMLMVGTTDGIYSINTDPTGNNFIASVVRIAKTPYLSREVLQIDDAIFFISDKGLMVTKNGSKPISLSYDFFPGQGDNDYPINEDIFPNYNVLTDEYFNGSNLYILTDIINYLKGAKLAYDSRRNCIWCSNPYEEFSLIYDITNSAWGMSSTVFSEAIELYDTLSTNSGDIYSWYLVMDNNSLQPYLMILSGEDMESEVFVHMLTRPIKFNRKQIEIADNYKKVQRLFTRCELYRDNNETGYFTFGMWGKQDLNQFKLNFPMSALFDGTQAAFPDNVRQDIPMGTKKGKYKAISLLFGGQVLPNSSINGFDFETMLVDNSLMR